MYKFFIVSDVHSHFDELMTALDEAGYDKNNPEHIFVSCGDLLDRGSHPIKCLEFVNSIPKERKALIRGNHEVLLMQALNRGDIGWHDYHNGTADTIMQLTGYATKTGFVDKNKSDIKDIYYNLKYLPILEEYYNCLVNYYETDRFIYVHGWYPHWHPNWRELNVTGWDEAVWLNGFENGFAGNNNTKKNIIFGHWHCSTGWATEFPDKYVEFKNIKTRDLKRELKEKDIRIENFEPYYGTNFIGIDACTTYSGKVNCLVIEDKLLKEHTYENNND